MASRRKKKRNRQLRDQEQNGSNPRKDQDRDAQDYNDFDYDAQYNTDYDTDSYDDDDSGDNGSDNGGDYDETVYGDVDRDYREDAKKDVSYEKAVTPEVAPQEEKRQQPEVTSVVADTTAPPPLPKHQESKDQPFSGPHIKFPLNAKRKASSSNEDADRTSGKDRLAKEQAGSIEAGSIEAVSIEAGPKKPGILKQWFKKDKASEGDNATGDPSSPSAVGEPPKKELPKKPKRLAKKDAKFTASKSIDPKTDEEILAAAPKRRWRARVFWALFALVVLIWALPMIVTKTPLLNMVLAQATADLDGTAEVKSVSCGWFSGIAIEGINVKDRQGNTIMEVPSVEGDRSLLGLLWNSSNLGHFKLEKPTVHVVLGPDGSTNLETLIAKYLEGPSDSSDSDSSSDPMDLGIEVIDARVTLSAVDPALAKSKQQPQTLLTLSEVNASVAMLADPNSPVSTSMEVTASVDSGKKVKPGHFAAKLGLGRQNQLTVDAKQLVFDRFKPLLARVASGLELQGSMNGKLNCSWGEVADSAPAADNKGKKDHTADDLLVVANAQLDGFSATGGPFGTDRLVLAKPTVACELSGKAGVYVLRQANLDSEVATLALDGQVVLDANMFSGTAKNAATSPVANGTVATQTFDLNGRIDLVRLAEMLPTTLHLHDQTKVNSGELTLKISAVEGKDLTPLASGATPLVWNAHVQTSDLTAMRYGRELVWHQPVTLTLHAHQADRGGAVVDQLLCTSNFLRAEAEGSIDQCNAAASFDLNKLMNQLGAFVDLGGLQMRGQGWANLNWRRAATQNNSLAQATNTAGKDGFVLDGDCQLRDLEISVTQPNVDELVPIGNPTLASSHSLFKRPWHESLVVIILSATGQMPTDGPISLASGEVRIKSGQSQIPGQFDEQIIARLTAPVKDVSAKTVWPVAVNAQGQLGRWSERAHAFGIANDWFAQGVYDAQLGGSYAAENVNFDNVSVKIQQFNVAGPSINFNEPQVELTLAGHYDQPQSRLLVNQATCKMTAAMLTAEELIVGTPADKPLELAGTVGLEGNLARMQGWIADPRQPSAWTWQGYVKGSARLKQIDGIVSGNMEGTLQDLQLSDRAGHRFYEPKMLLAADGKYNSTTRVVDLTSAKLTSNVMSGQVQGKLISGKDPMQSDFAGTMDCNMQRLSDLLVPYLGPGVRFQGISQNRLKLAGPMTLDRLNAQAGIGWDSGQIYGFNLGKGKLDFTLADGLVSSSPIQMPVSGGRINVAPQLRVAPGAMQLEVPPGVIAENIQINPQMCKGGLKYIAPILADVATADGRFSLAFDRCRIPVDNPSSGELAGRFMVHEMTVGGGPLLKQLAPVLKNAATPAKLQQESVVQFHMVDGRVYHKGLELIFPDITIKTHGYVGLDQSMNIIAEMPVPQKWIDQTGGSIRPALLNQKVTLPITGSLSQPRLDQRQIQQAMQRFLANAAGNILEAEGRRLLNQGLNGNNINESINQGINNGLNQLFGK